MPNSYPLLQDHLRIGVLFDLMRPIFRDVGLRFLNVPSMLSCDDFIEYTIKTEANTLTCVVLKIKAVL